MATFDAGSIESRLVLDRSDFTSGLREARAEGARFERETFEARLTVDSRGVPQAIAQVRSQLATLRNVNVNVGVTGSNSQIRAISQSAGALDGRSVSMSVEVQGADAAAARLRTVRQLAFSLNGYRATVMVDVDTGAAQAQLAALRAQLAALDGQTTTTTTRVNALATSSRAGAFAMRLAADAAIILGPALIPIAANALAAGMALVTMAGMAAGAAATWGVALGGSIKKVTELDKAVEDAKKKLDTQRQALKLLEPGTDAYARQLKKVEEAQRAVTAAQNAYTPTQLRFSKGLDELKKAWTAFTRATESSTLPVATMFIRGLTEMLPKAVPLVKAMAPEMEAIAYAFRGWVNDGGADRFFKLLAGPGVQAFHNLRLATANVLTVLGNLFRASVPRAVELSRAIERITGRMAVWSNEGGFERFLKTVARQSPEVKEFFKALGDALGNVYQAVAPLGMPMLQLATIFLKIVAAIPPEFLTALYVGFMAFRAVSTLIVIFRGVATAITAVRSAIFILSLAFRATPIGLLITGITLLVSAIVWIATKTTWFQTAWKFAWDGIKTAALWVWNNALKPAWNGIRAGLDAIGKAAMWLWKNAIKPAFNGIWVAARFLVVVLGTILFTPLYLAFKLLRAVVMAFYTYAIKPVFQGIAAVARWLWNNALKPTFFFMQVGMKVVGGWAKWLWDHAFKPAWNLIRAGARITWLGLKAAFGFIMDGLRAVGRWAKWLWDHAFKPVFKWIGDGAKWLWNKGIKPAFGWISDGMKTVGKWAKWLWTNGIEPYWDKIRKGTGILKDGMLKTWDKMKEGIGKIWNAIKKIAAVPINFVIREVYNGGIVKVWNKIASAVGLSKMKLSNASQIKYATGGAIEGGVAGTDSRSILAMPGEHVWTAEEVKNAGGHNAMAQMRSMFSSTGKARIAPSSSAVTDYARGSGQRFAQGGGILDWASDSWDAVKGLASNAWSAAKGISSAVWDKIKDVARGAIGPVAFPILKGIRTGVRTGINAVIPGSPPWQDLAAGTATKPIDMLMDWISKDDAKFMGGANVAKALAWAKTQEGKPYIWGGVGPKGYDCSGFMSAIQNVIDGRSPYSRRWATGAFPPGPKGWKRNLHAPFTVGITNAGVGHTAGTLAGTNVESRGGRGVIVGAGARGTKSGLFTSEWGYVPSMGGAGGSGRWAETVSAVLRELGVYSAGNVANVLKAIQKESGGNPAATNNWDSNARAGNPSKGLLQVIRTTFNAYAGKYRSRGQLDPYANIYAAVRYARSRYGSGWAARMARPGGYAAGGVTVPGVHMVGEKGPELIATSGGDRVITASETQQMLRTARGGGGSPVIVKMPETIKVRIGEREFDAYVEDISAGVFAAEIDSAVGSR